ncbi:hypothetical protein F5Y07DRAFT_411017 [Xylaria sp. FL0933]|nr:hypothetical protein F5Y07DRAFT_411017 [Xylaria sp. FL0933]
MDPQQSPPPSSSVVSVPPPAPLSIYSTYKPQTFQPTCTHLTMTRLCTQDREHLTVDALGKKQEVSFDELGSALSNVVSPGARSPERRANKLSFFEEVTDTQMRTYSPSQVATILQQRENLLGVLSKQHQSSSKERHLYCPSGSSRGDSLQSALGLGSPASSNTKPWVPQKDEECQQKYCHTCRPSCEPRSYLSLNGIANGEIPPTAAIGFGFHQIGTRPVVNAEVVKNIGLRPVPWPRAESHVYSPSASSQSTWSLSDIIEGQILETNYVESEPNLDLGEGSTIDSVISTPSQVNSFEQPRPAFTPPSTPVSWTGISRQDNGTVDFQHSPFVCDGRSPESLKTNSQVRRQVVESIAGLMHQDLAEDEVEEFQSICSFKREDQSKSLGASLDSNNIQRGITPMMLEELEDGRFHHDPLDVGDGIAVLEESVELGVPDVITKV